MDLLPSLKQQVVAKEFAAVRQHRAPAAAAAVGQDGSISELVDAQHGGTLTAAVMQLLRHAFIIVAGDPGARVLPHQLTQVAVLAGLDPAAPPVVKLLDRLRQESASSGGSGLRLDSLTHVLAHWRETPLAEQPQLLQQQQVVQDQEHQQRHEEEWHVDDDDVLARHVAAHRPASDTRVAALAADAAVAGGA